MDHVSAPANQLSQQECTHLAPEEVLERLDSLADEEKRKLRLIEHRRLGGTDFSPHMLYQEAVVQAITGERLCPRDVPFVAFLAQTMRSLASHRRDVLRRQVSTDELDGAHQRLLASDQLDPEQALIEREASDLVAELMGMMEGDDEAQITILAIAEGKKGKELCQALGVEQTQVDYILRRIKKARAKKYPNGWPA